MNMEQLFTYFPDPRIREYPLRQPGHLPKIGERIYFFCTVGRNFVESLSRGDCGGRAALKRV